jgi:general secretion pathway protein F
MPTFAYRAVDREGNRLAGHADAPTPHAAARALEERGLVVLEVRDAPAPARVGRPAFRRGARRRGVLDATRALASLLGAGLSLARALGAAELAVDRQTAERLASVRSGVVRGESLSAALAEHPDLFPPVYVGLVRAGERSGKLTETFARLAVQLEREDELRAKLVSALIYPTLLAVAGGGAVVLLLLFVLPRFAELLQGAGASLPTSTAALVAVSTTLRERWWLVLLVPLAIVAIVALMRSTEGGSRALSSAAYALPLVGTLRRERTSARFARLTSVLLAGGAPLLAALADTTESLGDPLARDEAARVRARVREGEPLARAVGDARLFVPLLTQLVAVGEESGRLQDFLAKAADILEQRAERSTTRLVALTEPALIIFFGGVVGFVALSLLQAIYGINAGSFR